ncbi:MAG: flagellar biosynthesis anti-sigma factor FlgM [Candidatus Competibacter denitrificans]
MAINPINGIYSPPVRGSGVERAVSSNVATLRGKPVGEVDQVQLTPGSVSLRQLETESQTPPIDHAKVAALREAINNGTYQVDPERIARKMSDFESALFP